MIDHATTDTELAPVTIRLAEPGDCPALERLARLDERLLGDAPLLVAESDGALVAALSLADGTVLADPFRYTIETIALLQQRARALEPIELREGPTRRALRSVASRPVVLVGALAAVLAIGTATGQAAPRPALPAGAWAGSGIARGAAMDSGIPSKFGAKLRFSIVVGTDGRVHGTGTFSSAMVVGGDVPGAIASRAAVTFRGTSTEVVYTGTASSRGTFGGITRTLKPIALEQRLPISRAGACKAAGSFVLNGVAFRWTATRKIAGTCRT